MSQTICMGLPSNLHPPDLCVLSSLDYSHEPWVSSSAFFLNGKLCGRYLNRISHIHLNLVENL
jgi:hypothetical protein